MNTCDRRRFIKLLGGSGLMLASINPLSVLAQAKSPSARVIIVGGGFGGATCAKYLNMFDPSLSITLIAPTNRFTTCPFSNAVLGGMRDMDSISHGYHAFVKRGINVVHDKVTEIDATGKKVTLSNGKMLPYDRLVLSPGIDFRWDEIDGMNASEAELIPHAWKGGPQTTLLRDQLVAMKDGGVPFTGKPIPLPTRAL